jgi:Uma2 family endonuclease
MIDAIAVFRSRNQGNPVMSATETSRQKHSVERSVPPLEAGDHLDQPTFHRRYEAMPPGFRAELIGGIVYVPARGTIPHSNCSTAITYWLGCYEGHTPGIESLKNTTVILADDSEPQPDAALRILESHGGQTRENEDEYQVGAPEFVVEVASSSASYDLHSKLRDYERYGVKEYVVIVVRQKAVRWFVHDGKAFVEHPADADGIFRSKLFGGLWLDPAALFARNLKRLREVVESGLASPEHAATVKRLAEAAAKA